MARPGCIARTCLFVAIVVISYEQRIQLRPSLPNQFGGYEFCCPLMLIASACDTFSADHHCDQAATFAGIILINPLGYLSRCADSMIGFLFAIGDCRRYEVIPSPLQVQTVWSNLMKTLGSVREVQAQLSVESAAFEQVQTEFFGLMDQFRTTNNVLKVNHHGWRPAKHHFLEVLSEIASGSKACTRAALMHWWSPSGSADSLLKASNMAAP